MFLTDEINYVLFHVKNNLNKELKIDKLIN